MAIRRLSFAGYRTKSQIPKKSNTASYFPYGAPNFEHIQYNQQFLVDKTKYIPQLEDEAAHILFLRPPRWGKSQLLDMLKCYYDINKASQFRKLFGGLAVGKKRTSLHNSFHVLKLNFSIHIGNNLETISQELHYEINSALASFASCYNLTFDINEASSFVSLKNMGRLMARKRGRLLVLIDEYDRFANKLMLEKPAVYAQVIAGTSGDPESSPIRAFYETLKTIKAPDYRTISMGLIPITLADEASGANFLLNISHRAEFGDIVGFTRSDLRRALSEINITDDRAESLLDVMTRFYNGYRFFGSTEPLYNSTLCLYFLQLLTKPEKLDAILTYAKTKNPLPNETIKFMCDIIDTNVQISENVIRLISRLPIDVREIISKLLNTSPESVTEINAFPNSFKIREMLGVLEESDKTHTTKVRELLFSYMFHHGLVTLGESYVPTYDKGIPLRIPNEMVRGPMMDHLQQFLRLDEMNIIDTIKNPSDEGVKKLILSIVSKQQTLHDNSFSEGALQGEIESALRACAHYTGGGFIVSAEKVLYKEKRCDLMLIVKEENEKFILLIELKRIRPNSLGKQYDSLSNKLLQNFCSSWSEKSDSELRKSPIVKYVGKYSIPEDYVYEVEDKATEQVLKYKALLQKKNSSFSSHVRAYTVVQVGWPLLVKEAFEME